jgi:hypothetical protein
VARLEASARGGGGDGHSGQRGDPKIAVVAPPSRFTALDGVAYDASRPTWSARCISMGNATAPSR